MMVVMIETKMMVTKIMMMDYDEDVDKDDLIAAAGAASSRPLKVLPGPCKCSPQLHDLSHLVIISVKAMVMTIMISIIVLMIVVLLKCSMLIVTTRSPKAPSQTQAPPTLNRAHISPNQKKHPPKHRHHDHRYLLLPLWPALGPGQLRASVPHCGPRPPAPAHAIGCLTISIFVMSMFVMRMLMMSMFVMRMVIMKPIMTKQTRTKL